jgi:catechol 2,3-dioxygenase
VSITGAADHGVNEAFYLTDPDGNPLALSWDRPVRNWPRTAEGRVAVVDLPLDIESLLDPRGDTANRRIR